MGNMNSGTVNWLNNANAANTRPVVNLSVMSLVSIDKNTANVTKVMKIDDKCVRKAEDILTRVIIHVRV